MTGRSTWRRYSCRAVARQGKPKLTRHQPAFCGTSFSLSKRAELALSLRAMMHSLTVSETQCADTGPRPGSGPETRQAQVNFPSPPKPWGRPQEFGVATLPAGASAPRYRAAKLAGENRRQARPRAGPQTNRRQASGLFAAHPTRAIGRTGDPVAPSIFSGIATNKNSRAPAFANSSRFRHSTM